MKITCSIAVCVVICCLALTHAYTTGSFEDNEDESSEQTRVDNNLINGLEDDENDYNPREALLTYLLKQAHPKVPPASRYLPIQVQVKTRPLHIDEVCTKTYHIKLPILESYNWTDPRLAWNESNFGGVKWISLDAADIWMPDIGIYQSSVSSALKTRTKDFRPVINSVGRVLFTPRTNYVIACSGRTWLNVSGTGKLAKNNNNSETGTFACEFDQGSWSHDLTTVDTIPVVAGGLATTKADKKIIAKQSTQQPPVYQPKTKQQKSTPNRAVYKKVNVSREYTQKDYNATADLSWFESNKLYDAQSFEVKRVVMQYPAMGTEEWPSMHYRLVFRVLQNKSENTSKNYFAQTELAPASSNNTLPALTVLSSLDTKNITAV